MTQIFADFLQLLYHKQNLFTHLSSSTREKMEYTKVLYRLHTNLKIINMKITPLNDM